MMNEYLKLHLRNGEELKIQGFRYVNNHSIECFVIRQHGVVEAIGPKSFFTCDIRYIVNEFGEKLHFTKNVNYYPKIANMLGVLLGETFTYDVEDSDGNAYECKFERDGFYYRTDDSDNWKMADVFHQLITGEYPIVRHKSWQGQKR